MSRFSGENFLAHRHFKKVPCKVKDRLVSIYNGKSVIVVTKYTPFVLEYNMKTERVCVTFYVQRYDGNDLPMDTSLQSLMNRVEI